MMFYMHHLGDYAQATAHLSALEDGIYSRMLRWYYSSEKPLPADVAQVARLVRAQTKQEREAVIRMLDEFFHLEADGWRQHRCDREIEQYNEKQRKASASANKRWKKHDAYSEGNANAYANACANAPPNAMRTHFEGNANQEPRTKNQEKTLSLATLTGRSEGVGKPVLQEAASPPQSESPALSASPPEAVNHDAVSPGLISRQLRQANIDSNPGDPRLIALAEQGVSLQTVEAACEQARRAKPPPERIPVGYVVGILEGWARKAASTQVAGALKPGLLSAQDYADIAEGRVWQCTPTT